MSSHIPRRDSWPPTQMRLHPSIEEPSDDLVPDLDLSFIDDDPLNYFLTPAPSSQDSEMDLDLDLGAGISTPRRKAPLVRSVSPSSLDPGLSLPRPPTPPRSFGSRSPEPDDDLDMAPSTPEEEEEEEEPYLRFFGGDPSPLTPPPFEMPFSLKDFAHLRAKSAGRAKGKGGAGGAATLLSPAPPTVHGGGAAASGGRGRLSRRPGPRPLGALDAARGRTRSWSFSSSSGRLSPRAWREPSPDVWSIEEETEEDVANSEVGDGGVDEGAAKAVDIPKVKKRVRFVLPVRETV